MIIVQISDLHITYQNQRAHGCAPTAGNLKRCVEHINQLEPAADVVLVTGDICNDAHIEEAEYAARILSALNSPYYIVPGNHDRRDILLSAFDKNTYALDERGFFNYVIDDYDMRLIGLDSLQEGKSSGKFSEKPAEWLSDCLDQYNDDKPTLLFMHHPPVKCGIAETDLQVFKGKKRLGKIISKHSNIEQILCGHIHTQVHIRWKGSIISTAPSTTGMKIEPDLTLKKPSQFFLDSPNYLLHYWSPDENMITYHIEVSTLEGPFLFDEDDDMLESIAV